MFRIRSCRSLVTTACALACASSAVAQNAPPAPALTRTSPAWVGIVIMIFMVILVVTVSLISSKRGHQD